LSKSLLEWGDPYFVLADYRAYIETQEKVDQTFGDKSQWAQMVINNVAGSGKFSSDRTIAEYAEDIWKLEKVS
jgi:starch phosphorylase